MLIKFFAKIPQIEKLIRHVKPIVFDTSDMKIICPKAPSSAYSLEVKYYDNDGNVYE